MLIKQLGILVKLTTILCDRMVLTTVRRLRYSQMLMCTDFLYCVKTSGREMRAITDVNIFFTLI